MAAVSSFDAFRRRSMSKGIVNHVACCLLKFKKILGPRLGDYLT